MEHEDDSDTSKIPSPKNNPEEPRKLSMETGDYGKDWDCPDHSTVEIS